MARPLRFSDLLDMRRAGSPVVSPDGTTVVFTAVQPDLEENRNETHLYRVPVNGGEVVQLDRDLFAQGHGVRWVPGRQHNWCAEKRR